MIAPPDPPDKRPVNTDRPVPSLKTDRSVPCRDNPPPSRRQRNHRRPPGAPEALSEPFSRGHEADCAPNTGFEPALSCVAHPRGSPVVYTLNQNRNGDRHCSTSERPPGALVANAGTMFRPPEECNQEQTPRSSSPDRPASPAFARLPLPGSSHPMPAPQPHTCRARGPQRGYTTPSEASGAAYHQVCIQRAERVDIRIGHNP